jgi:hypothetical protein
MTPPPGRQPPSLLLTVVRAVLILVGLILMARLVPIAIRAIGGAGRSGAQLIGELGPLWWIFAAVLAVATAVTLVGRARRRGRGRPADRRPPTSPPN